MKMNLFVISCRVTSTKKMEWCCANDSAERGDTLYSLYLSVPMDEAGNPTIEINELAVPPGTRVSGEFESFGEKRKGDRGDTWFQPLSVVGELTLSSTHSRTVTEAEISAIRALRK